MFTQAQNQRPLSADPTVPPIRARTNLHHQLQARVLVLSAVSPVNRRMTLHLLVLAIVVAAAGVGAIAN